MVAIHPIATDIDKETGITQITLLPPVKGNTSLIETNGTKVGKKYLPIVLTAWVETNSNSNEVKSETSHNFMRRTKCVLLSSSITVIVVLALLATVIPAVLHSRQDTEHVNSGQHISNVTDESSFTTQPDVTTTPDVITTTSPSSVLCEQDIVIVLDSSHKTNNFFMKVSDMMEDTLNTFKSIPVLMDISLLLVSNGFALEYLVINNYAFVFRDFNVDGSDQDFDRILLTDFPSMIEYAQNNVLAQKRNNIPDILILIWDGLDQIYEEVNILYPTTRVIAITPQHSFPNATNAVTSTKDIFYVDPDSDVSDFPGNMFDSLCNLYVPKIQCQKDIVVIIDTGFGLNQYWQHIQEILNELVDRYRIGPLGMLVSVIVLNTENSTGIIAWDLISDNTVNDTAFCDSINEISSIHGIQNITNIAEALSLSERTIFPGGRSDIDDMIIIFSSGTYNLHSSVEPFNYNNRIILVSPNVNMDPGINNIVTSPVDIIFLEESPDNSSVVDDMNLCSNYPHVSCEQRSSPVNGQIELPRTTTTTHGGTAIYSCDEGFRMIGNYIIGCQADGMWNDTEPICDLIDCGEIIAPSRYIVTTNHTKYNGNTVYSCADGFQLFGSSSRTCQKDETWSGIEPQCFATLCDQVPEIDNGKTIFTGLENESIYQGRVHYSCNDGYVLEGDAVRYCQSDYSWAGTAPYCRRIDCGDINVDSRYIITTDHTKYNGITVYSCADGFQLFGSSSRTCQMDETWSGTEPQCFATLCDQVPEIDNGNTIFTGLESESIYQGRVQYSCNDGYVLEGDAVRYCQSDYSWTGSASYCRRVDCGDPGDLPGGTVSGCTTYDCVATFRCGGTNLEYGGVVQEAQYVRGTTSRTSTRKCQSDGTWSDSIPSCCFHSNFYAGNDDHQCGICV